MCVCVQACTRWAVEKTSWKGMGSEVEEGKGFAEAEWGEGILITQHFLDWSFLSDKV